MNIYVYNDLGIPVHVAVIQRPSSAFWFLISTRRVRTPSGTVKHFDLAPGETVRMRNVPDKTPIEIRFKLPYTSVRVEQIEGTDDDGASYAQFKIQLPPHLQPS